MSALLSPTLSRGTIARLLIAATCLHVAATVAVYLAGHYALMPQAFEPDGIANAFASDGRLYMTEVRELTEDLTHGRLGEWLTTPYPIHTKLYSLSFAALVWLFGYSILSAEPVNLACYLTILALVYRLGAKTFDARAGLITAVVVAFMPSFLLHTTQLLKDPLLIVAILGLVVAGVQLLSTNLSLPESIRAGSAGGASFLGVWLLRPDMYPIALVIVLTMAVLVATYAFWFRKGRSGIVGLAIILVAMLSVPFLISAYRTPPPDSEAGKTIGVAPLTADCERRLAAARQQGGFDEGFGSLHARLVRSRIMATCVIGSGSNIDAGIELISVKDIVLYLPRAVAIGLFAPMPNMWFTAGSQVGTKGRILSGGEMLFTYLIELLALGGLWVGRRRLTTWLLLLSSAVGVIALGYAMPNVGTLYRMRYPFWILLVVLAAGFVSSVVTNRIKQHVTEINRRGNFGLLLNRSRAEI